VTWTSTIRIVPELSVRRGQAAIEFYREAFGAKVDYLVGGTPNNPDVVAQLSVGEATFWVSDESRPNATSARSRSVAEPSASC